MLPITFARFADAPKPGELWIRPVAEEDRKKHRVALLVYDQRQGDWRSALQSCPGPIERIVVDASGVQPTFDEMLAAFFAGLLLEEKELPEWFRDLGRYAEMLRQGKTPTGLPPEETIEGVYLAIRNMGGDEILDEKGKITPRGEDFRERWEKVTARFLMLPKQGVDVFAQGLFASPEFADERAYARDEDERRYRRDVEHGERWTVILPGKEKRESGLLLRNPESSRFASLSRTDKETPTGEPYQFLAVLWGKADWVFSTDPAFKPGPLKSLAEKLQQAEDSRAPKDPQGSVAQPSPKWYDGNDKHYTMVGAPKNPPTRLEEREILGTVKKWARAKKASKSPKVKIHRLVLDCAIVLSLVAVVLLAVQTGKLIWPPDPYWEVAPAVVLIQTGTEHGTGFLVSKDGWVVTNSHVVRSARPDALGRRAVQVYLGRQKNGRMQRNAEPLSAVVYKDDRRLDLALIKLMNIEGLLPLPFLKLASSEQEFPSGLKCLAIGHPIGGRLWQPSPGEVTGTMGNFPSDMVEFQLLREQFEREKNPKDRARLEALFKELAEVKRKVLLSSCQLAPGNSGGPLVDLNGQVIGVSFAIPKALTPQGGVIAAYHVHLDELKEFLPEDFADLQPMGYPLPILPSDWPAQKGCTLTPDYQVVKRGKQYDVVLVELPVEGKLSKAMLVDVMGKNLVDLKGRKLVDEDGQGLPEQVQTAVKEGKWPYQFAVGWNPLPTAFYDTDGKGRIDLIVQTTAPDKEPDIVWRLRGGKWVPASPPGGRTFVSPEWFDQAEVRKAFKERVQDNKTFQGRQQDARAAWERAQSE